MELESPPEYKRALTKEGYDILNELRDYCNEKLGALSHVGMSAYESGDFQTSSDIADVRGCLAGTIFAIDIILDY